MRKFSLISDGMDAMQQMVETNRRKVGALITFQHTNKKLCQTCFLFESVEDKGAQLLKKFPDFFAMPRVDPSEMRRVLAERQVLIDTVLEMNSDDELVLSDPAHAEEYLIDNFRYVCSQISSIRFVTIYLTHSPCTLEDRKPSNSLHNWPNSCTAKFGILAKQFPKYFFTICYWKKFGFMEGRSNSESLLKAKAGNVTNLGFFDMS